MQAVWTLMESFMWYHFYLSVRTKRKRKGKREGERGLEMCGQGEQSE